MIKKLTIKNFRNLTELDIQLSETTIISGKNELGKSNALNALMWLLTGTILTDKWGSGENDIDSIVPKNATRGINPEVAIYFEKGEKFSKKYISKWSKDGSKVTGHTTEFYINDVVCKNETEFIEALYPKLNFTPVLKTKEVNELRLFTDPLYALQKLDAKQLRALLVDLGCSVTDEELYKAGFDDLRPYGDQYMGKWDVFRKQLKDKNKALTKDIETLQAKLETVASVEEYDEAKLTELNKKLEELIGKKANIKANNNNPEINELETQVAVVSNTITNKITNHTHNIQVQKSNLNIKRQTVLDKVMQESNSKANPIKEEISKVTSEIAKLESSLNAYQVTLNTSSNMVKTYIELGKSTQARKNDLAIKLDVTRNKTYEGKITCPVCGTEFADSEEREQEFLNHQKEEIDNFIKEIAKCDDNLAKYKAEYEKYNKAKVDANTEIEKANTELTTLRNKLVDLQKQADEIKAMPIDMTEVNAIDDEIKALDLQKVDTSEEEKQLNELNLKLVNLKNANDLTIQDEINKIDIEITSLREQISNEIVAKSKYAEKLEFETNLAKTQEALNDNECLLARCNRLINTMISLINEKATAITGLTFVMLEENISNDGVKEVCYATIDNIPFKDVNTAKKLRYGVKFIEKLKTLLGQNTLPILADRMEGIDNLETIKTLTKEQLVCTRVSKEETITII